MLCAESTHICNTLFNLRPLCPNPIPQDQYIHLNSHLHEAKKKRSVSEWPMFKTYSLRAIVDELSDWHLDLDIFWPKSLKCPNFFREGNPTSKPIYPPVNPRLPNSAPRNITLLNPILNVPFRSCSSVCLTHAITCEITSATLTPNA